MSFRGKNIMQQYEVKVVGKWCRFEPGSLDNFDNWCPDTTFELDKCEKVYGRATVDIVSFRPAYLYFTCLTKDIRVI